jgi:hypothetical protein
MIIGRMMAGVRDTVSIWPLCYNPAVHNLKLPNNQTTCKGEPTLQSDSSKARTLQESQRRRTATANAAP